MTDASNAGTLPVTVPRAKPPTLVAGARISPLIPTSLEEAYRLGAVFFQAGMVPYGLKNEQAVSLVLMAGMELGLPPLQAMKNLMVVNNRVSIFGDGANMLIRRSGLLAGMKERIDGEGDDMVAVCEATRRNPDGSTENVTSTFSVADAKTAGLWSKRGRSGDPSPWQTYPKRMLAMRARGFALRDLFADVLGGMRTVEEEQDIERMEQTALVAPPPPPEPDAPAEGPAEERVLAAPPPPPEEDEALAEDASFLALVAQGTPEPQDAVSDYDVALSACKTTDEFDVVVEEWCSKINDLGRDDRMRALAVFERHMERVK